MSNPELTTPHSDPEPTATNSDPEPTTTDSDPEPTATNSDPEPTATNSDCPPSTTGQDVAAPPTVSVLPVSSRVVLLAAESRIEFEQFEAKIRKAVKPADGLEELWVADVVTLTWEIFRLRRYRTAFLDVSAHEGLRAILSAFLEEKFVADLVWRWRMGEEAARKRVSSLLSEIHHTTDHVMASTLTQHLDEIERMDRVIAATEDRRNDALHEIDRHRAVVAERLRHAVQEVEDAEFRVIEKDATEN